MSEFSVQGTDGRRIVSSFIVAQEQPKIMKTGDAVMLQSEGVGRVRVSMFGFFFHGVPALVTNPVDGRQLE